jgi:hypothetical protein
MLVVLSEAVWHQIEDWLIREILESSGRSLIEALSRNFPGKYYDYYYYYVVVKFGLKYLVLK